MDCDFPDICLTALVSAYSFWRFQGLRPHSELTYMVRSALRSSGRRSSRNLSLGLYHESHEFVEIPQKARRQLPSRPPQGPRVRHQQEEATLQGSPGVSLFLPLSKPAVASLARLWVASSPRKAPRHDALSASIILVIYRQGLGVTRPVNVKTLL